MTVKSELLLVGGDDGRLRALATADGTERWHYATGGALRARPTFAGGRIYLPSDDGERHCVDAATGQPRWRDYLWCSWIESSAVVHDDTAYVGSSDARQRTALDARSGQRRWVFRTAGSAWATPAVDREAVYVGRIGVQGYISAHRAGFFALMRTTGRPLWSFVPPPHDVGGYSGFAATPALDDERVYVGGLDGRVYAFDRRP